MRALQEELPGTKEGALMKHKAILLHDVGAFQIGIGATTLLALVWADGIMIVLAGYVVGTGVHLASHTIDRHIGGHAYDPVVLSVMVAAGLGGMYLQARASRRTPQRGPSGSDPDLT